LIQESIRFGKVENPWLVHSPPFSPQFHELILLLTEIIITGAHKHAIFAAAPLFAIVVQTADSLLGGKRELASLPAFHHHSLLEESKHVWDVMSMEKFQKTPLFLGVWTSAYWPQRFSVSIAVNTHS
jgi:hypothetical protein